MHPHSMPLLVLIIQQLDMSRASVDFQLDSTLNVQLVYRQRDRSKTDRSLGMIKSKQLKIY